MPTFGRQRSSTRNSDYGISPKPSSGTQHRAHPSDTFWCLQRVHHWSTQDHWYSTLSLYMCRLQWPWQPEPLSSHRRWLWPRCKCNCRQGHQWLCLRSSPYSAKTTICSAPSQTLTDIISLFLSYHLIYYRCYKSITQDSSPTLRGLSSMGAVVQQYLFAT